MKKKSELYDHYISILVEILVSNKVSLLEEKEENRQEYCRIGIRTANYYNSSYLLFPEIVQLEE
jgi:hypothetical protein